MAIKDLQGADSAEAQVSVGDAWWGLAEIRGGKERDAFLLRARSWYQRARQNLAPGLAQMKIAKRLEELSKLGQKVLPIAKTNSIGMRLALIPAGEALIGSEKSGQRRIGKAYEPRARASVRFCAVDFEVAQFNWGSSPGEGFQHRVKISRSFYLGVYEVTQAEYERVMGRNPSDFSPNGKYKDRVLGRTTGCFPVECVRWVDAVEFCRRLSDLPGEKGAGLVYRLPTEAEWEYACRAGSAGQWCFGDSESMLKEYAWFGDSSNSGSTHPVGLKQPNRFDLYDMHGNVGEWCQDWYSETYYRNSPLLDPAGPQEGNERVVRGGFWNIHGSRSRSANRDKASPLSQNFNIGFRVAAVAANN